MRYALAFLAAGLMTAASYAAPADHYTQADLAKIAEGLKAKAASGNASDTLARYPNHFTMLAYRNSDGNAEIHTQNADVFIIARGKVTLITEGSVPDAKETGPNELRGAAVIGGKSVVMTAGDIVHIPAGVPHQMLVAKGDEVVYFVVKIKEKE